MERYRFFDKYMILLIVFGIAVFSIAYVLAPATAGREMNIPPTNAFSTIITNGMNQTATEYNSVLYLNYPYAQISDSTTQACPVIAANVTLNTNDSIYKITHSTTTDTNEITMQENGVYQIIAVPQVGEAIAQGVGIHNFWMMKNNVPVPNSNIKTTIFLQVGGTETFTASLNWIGRLSSGDVISFQQSCTDADIGIIATPAGTPPATPSVIISIARIS